MRECFFFYFFKKGEDTGVRAGGHFSILFSIPCIVQFVLTDIDKKFNQILCEETNMK